MEAKERGDSRINNLHNMCHWCRLLCRLDTHRLRKNLCLHCWCPQQQRQHPDARLGSDVLCTMMAVGWYPNFKKPSASFCLLSRALWCKQADSSDRTSSDATCRQCLIWSRTQICTLPESEIFGQTLLEPHPGSILKSHLTATMARRQKEED